MGLTNIQWCDYTFNPWIGCRKVAPECKNCYAETLDNNRFSKTLGGASKENPVSHWGNGPRHRTSEGNWKEPLKWNRLAISRAVISPGFYPRPRVFCASLSDWLDDENVPIEWLADLLKLIHDTPNLDWLLLTKRPQNWHDRIVKCFDVLSLEPQWLVPWSMGTPPPNVWIGVSAGADQAAALVIPARIHFLSCEPMLKPMDTTHAAGFDWIIFGGESGKHARPCSMQWIMDGLVFCRENGVTPFVKQLGASVFAQELIPEQIVTLNDSHGGDMSEWPEDLCIREFPTIKPALT